jgi:glucosamine 6-phosphate synthetase-like amidotransferase/phosphosugar isomerase protein
VPTGLKKSYINTHSYIGQLAVLYYIFNDSDLSKEAEMALAQESMIKETAKKFADKQNFVFLSCGYGMVAAHQSAHKLREVVTHIKHTEAQSYDELLHAALPALYKQGTVFINLEYDTDHLQRRSHTKGVLKGLGSEVVDFTFDVDKYKAPIIMQIAPYLLTDEIAKLHGLNSDEPKDIGIIKNLVYEKTNKSKKI